MTTIASEFSLNGSVVTNCILHQIYDGDTFRVSAKFPQLTQPYTFKCRLRGIDTPEIRTKNDSEKQLGNMAKQFVIQAVAVTGVKKVRCYNFGKYGRLIVDVLLNDGRDLCTTLIDEKLGVPYNGHSNRKREDNFWYNMLQERKSLIKNNILKQHILFTRSTL